MAALALAERLPDEAAVVLAVSHDHRMVTMKGHGSVHLAVLVLVGVACGGSGDGNGVAPTAQAFTVEVDGKADGFSAGFPAFFPDQVTVHPGDSVTVKLNAASGQPHTATLGTLVDAGAARLAELGPQATLAAQESSPEMLRLPDAYPHEVTGGSESVRLLGETEVRNRARKLLRRVARPCLWPGHVRPFVAKGVR